MHITYHIYKNGIDKEALIAFLKSNLMHNVNTEIWNWEFETFPETELVYLKDNEKIIGSQSMLAVPLLMNGANILTYKSETSFVDGSYRGQDLFRKLYEYNIESIASYPYKNIWGFTALIKVWRKTLGFQVPENKIENIFLATFTERPNFKSAKESLKTIRNKIYRIVKSPKFIANSEIEIRTSSISLSELAEYQRRWHETRGFHCLAMEESYTNWRIYHNPVLNYFQFFAYDKTQKLCGYVFAVEKDNVLRLSSVHFDDEFILQNLMYEIVVLCKKNKFSGISYFGNPENEENAKLFRLLSQKGGRSTINKFMQFVFLGRNGELLQDTREWYLNGLWTEGFSM